MKKTILLLTIASFAITSCRMENNLVNSEKENQLNLETILIQERDPNSTLILRQENSLITVAQKNPLFNMDPTKPLDLVYYLGRAYKVTELPIGSGRNVTLPVIDFEKLFNTYPKSILHKTIRESTSGYFSYSNFERYEKNSSLTKKISGGFKLNLGLFSIGAKREMTRVFKNSEMEDKKRIFGELNVNIIAGSYELKHDADDKKEIGEKFLDPVFLKKLYNNRYDNLIDFYGPYIITSFYSGGRATALYTGINNKEATSESKEKDMNTSINASYGFKMGNNKDGNISAEFGLGKGEGNSSAMSKEITNLELSVKTLGGGGDFGVFSMPKKIEDVNINLSTWASSLNDPNTHVMMDIADDGLSSFSDYLLEENFKKQDAINDEYNLPRNQLKEPQIVVRPQAFYYKNNNELKQLTGLEIQVILITRFGDKIFLDAKDILAKENFDATPFTDSETLSVADKVRMIKAAEAVKNRLGNIYKIKIAVNIKPLAPRSLNSMMNISVDESKMKKYKNPNNNITYLLYSDGAKKFAYAVYDDFILGTYGIKEWVDNMPTTQISSKELYEYKIIGL